MAERSLTAIGCEIMQLDNGRLPVLAAISEIAGQMTIPIAAHLMRSSSGGRGILLGGTPGVPPARVVILGVGSVGFAAARAAAATGARVAAFDREPRKLRHIMEHVPGAETCLADEDAIADAVAAADVVIGAVLEAGTRTPHVVTRAMVERMKPGSAIIDVSIDQGGCVETSRPTTLADPTFVHKGVTHFCVPNFTADLGRSASVAIAQAMLPYLLDHRRHGVDAAIEAMRPICGAGVYHARGAGEAPMKRTITGRRIATADEALAVVQSGQRVYIHNGCAEPAELVEALTRRGPELRDVEVIHMATMGIADYSLPEHEGHFRTNALFIGAQRAPGRAGGPRRLHAHFPERDRRPVPLRRPAHRCGPAAVHAARPLRLHELRAQRRCHRSPWRSAPATLIVEINDQMPRTLGDAFLHVSRVDAFIETSHPLVEYPQPRGDGPAPRHRAQHRGADSRRRHHSDRHRRHPRSHAGPAGGPQGPRHPLRNGSRRRHRADPGRRHQRRAEDAASAQGDRRLLCWASKAAVRFHRQ